MKLVKELINVEKKHELVLGALLVLFILIDMPIPGELAKLVNTVYGNIVVVILALSLYGTGNYLLAILGVVAADALIRRSSDGSSSDNGDEKSSAFINLTNDDDNNTYGNYSGNDGLLPVTLEEDMVASMAPLVHHDGDSGSEKVEAHIRMSMPYADAADQ